MKKLFITLLITLSVYASFHLLNTTYVSIEKIYVINLDRSTQRYAHIQKTLDSMELPVKYSRFSAIDGRKIRFTNKSTGEILTGKEILEKEILLNGSFTAECSNNNVIEFNTSLDYYNPRLVGELGVSCSHKLIWEDIVNKGYKNALILEDDVIFGHDFDKSLAIATNNVPKDYDLLFLQHGNMGKAFKSEIQNEFLRTFMSFFDQHVKNPFWKQARKNIYAVQADIISKAGAEKLLKCQHKYSSGEFLVIDVVVSKCIEDKAMIAYAAAPKLAFSNLTPSYKSDIAELGKYLEE